MTIKHKSYYRYRGSTGCCYIDNESGMVHGHLIYRGDERTIGFRRELSDTGMGLADSLVDTFKGVVGDAQRPNPNNREDDICYSITDIYSEDGAVSPKGKCTLPTLKEVVLFHLLPTHPLHILMEIVNEVEGLTLAFDGNGIDWWKLPSNIQLLINTNHKMIRESEVPYTEEQIRALVDTLDMTIKE